MIYDSIARQNTFYESSTYKKLNFYCCYADSCQELRIATTNDQAIIGPNANLSKSDAGYYGFLECPLGFELLEGPFPLVEEVMMIQARFPVVKCLEVWFF